MGLALLIALAGLVAAAALSPLLARWLGRNAGYVLAATLAAGAVVLGLMAPAVIAGDAPGISVRWIPALDVRFTLRLDGLSLLFGLLVLGVGSLVMAYSARYLDADGSHGRFFGLLTLFAASMLGLVLAGDLILLFVFWELTSITSFFLIGGDGSPDEGRAASQALLVTGLGGLALFAGIVLLGLAAGSFDVGEVLAGRSAVLDHATAPAIMALVLVGAFTKSAQFPFHFWLPGAMVAPTPVSTYLHAATMVKAGIYLLARLSPVFAGSPAWLYAIVLTGLVTAVLGAGLALKQHDLKALLAYSTVSQLGFITALVGVGTFPALAAAAAHTMAHAAYKATLFMVVGIIDHEAGSRDIRELSGLRRAMPLTATVTGVAALSMAGFPPLLGFVSKEEAFGAFLATPGAAWLGPVAAGLAVCAAIMTFAYGARIFDGAFEGPLKQDLYDPGRSFLAPAAVTALASVGLGATVSWLNPFVDRVAEAALGAPGSVDLALWHGITPALGLSAVTIATGVALFLGRGRVDRTLQGLRSPLEGGTAFDGLHRGVVTLGRGVGKPFVSRAPAAHLAWILGTAGVVAVWAWVSWGRVPGGSAPLGRPVDWVIAVVLGAGIAGAALAASRLAALATVGVLGFLIAVLYVVLGAPDLALTQLLVEALTVFLVVVVFRRLPTLFRPVRALRRVAAAIAALGAGGLAFAATAALTGRRGLSPAGASFLASAEAEAGGGNVVNTILVDFRALDTLGEITVLAAAAMGVIAMVRATRRRGARG